jgi:hypothetical protein
MYAGMHVQGWGRIAVVYMIHLQSRVPQTNVAFFDVDSFHLFL